MKATWLVAVLASIPAGEAPFELVGTEDGVTVEARSVPTSGYAELRLKATSKATVDALCAAAYGTGKYDPDEPHLIRRQVLSERADERVTYEQVAPPMVSKRDYALRRRKVAVGERCKVEFETANEAAPALQEGWVRMTTMKGTWRFEPLPTGGTQVEYQLLVDPGGSLPAWMVQRGQRQLSVQWVERIVARAEHAR